MIVEEDIVDWAKLEYFVTYSVTGKTYKAHVAPWRIGFKWRLKKLFPVGPNKDSEGMK